MIYALFSISILLNIIFICVFYIIITKKLIKYELNYHKDTELIESLIGEFNRVAELKISEIDEKIEVYRKESSVNIDNKKKRKAILNQNQMQRLVKSMSDKGIDKNEMANRLGMSLQEIELLQENN